MGVNESAFLPLTPLLCSHQVIHSPKQSGDVGTPVVSSPFANEETGLESYLKEPC